MRVERGGKYLAVASIGGGPVQPGVVLQLPRQPGRRAPGRPGAELYRARLLEGAERGRWAYAVQTWSTYGVY